MHWRRCQQKKDAEIHGWVHFKRSPQKQGRTNPSCPLIPVILIGAIAQILTYFNFLREFWRTHFGHESFGGFRILWFEVVDTDFRVIYKRIHWRISVQHMYTPFGTLKMVFNGFNGILKWMWLWLAQPCAKRIIVALKYTPRYQSLFLQILVLIHYIHL